MRNGSTGRRSFLSKSDSGDADRHRTSKIEDQGTGVCVCFCFVVVVLSNGPRPNPNYAHFTISLQTFNLIHSSLPRALLLAPHAAAAAAQVSDLFNGASAWRCRALCVCVFGVFMGCQPPFQLTVHCCQRRGDDSIMHMRWIDRRGAHVGIIHVSYT